MAVCEQTAPTPQPPSQLATSPRHTNPWALSERVGEQAPFLADLFILR